MYAPVCRRFCTFRLHMPHVPATPAPVPAHTATIPYVWNACHNTVSANPSLNNDAVDSWDYSRAIPGLQRNIYMPGSKRGAAAGHLFIMPQYSMTLNGIS